MAIGLPEMPTGNMWSTIGQGLQQGSGIVNNLGEQQNALQAMVERRTQAALEQKRLEREAAQRDWAFQQKQDDDAKKQAFVDSFIKMQQKGVQGPDTTTTTPAETRKLASPSSNIPQEMPTSIGAIAAPQLGYPTPSPAVPQVSYPEQTITTPGAMRPATTQDYKDLAFSHEQMSPSEYFKPTPYQEAKDQAAGKLAGSIPNADGVPPYAKMAAQYKIDNPTASQAEIMAKVGQLYPEAGYDTKFINSFVKTNDKEAAIKNADSVAIKAEAATTNAKTAEDRLAEQKVRDNLIATKIAAGSSSSDANRSTLAQLKVNKEYRTATNSSRQGVALGNAAGAYETITRTLEDPTVAEFAVTGLKDQLSKLLNPGYAVNKTQFDHLSAGGLTDQVSNWIDHLGHGYKQLQPDQVAQYKEYVKRIGIELAEAHQRIAEPFRASVVDYNTRNKWDGPMAVKLREEKYGFDNLLNPQPTESTAIPSVKTESQPIGFADKDKQARYEAWKKAHGQ